MIQSHLRFSQIRQGLALRHLLSVSLVLRALRFHTRGRRLRTLARLARLLETVNLAQVGSDLAPAIISRTSRVDRAIVTRAHSSDRNERQPHRFPHGIGDFTSISLHRLEQLSDGLFADLRVLAYIAQGLSRARNLLANIGGQLKQLDFVFRHGKTPSR